MSKQREIGQIKTYDPIKGYGFISRPRGKDVFVNYADFAVKGRDAAAVAGSNVEFELEVTEKGPRARNVQILG